MTSIVYTKIAAHRGGARLWLEGTRLSREGIQPAQRYTVDYDHRNQRLTLKITANGNHTISSRHKKSEKIPVIDINNRDLKKLFGSVVDAVKVVIKGSGIVVTLHHHIVKLRERLQRFKKKLASKNPLDLVSLAHGGGILDHALHVGFHGAGIPVRLAAAVEIDRRYLDCSIRNNPIWDDETIAVEGPMQEVEFDTLVNCEVIVAGLPCTGASLAGRAKNKLKEAEQHKDAGSLFVTFIESIKSLQPAIVILENVVPYQSTVSMTVIRDSLNYLGYEIHETVLSGNEFGAIENRNRLCMVAVTRGIEFSFEHLETMTDHATAIQDILEDIPINSDRWKVLDYLAKKEAADRAAGKGFRRQILNGNEAQCGVIGKSYSKYRSTEPMVKHPTEDKFRLLTRYEHAAVKTVPSFLVDGISDTVSHEIMGQGVIHSAFVALGACIARSVVGLQESEAMPCRYASNELSETQDSTDCHQLVLL